MKKLVISVLVLTVIMCLPIITSAQGPDPGCDPLDPACPIDGGLVFLIAAGAGLGAKKIMRKK